MGQHVENHNIMYKYGTYNIYKNTTTGKLKRIPLSDEDELIKIGSQSEWILLDNEPELEKKDDRARWQDEDTDILS